MRHYVGLDLGERQDHTAIVALAVEEHPDPLAGAQVIRMGKKPEEEPAVYHVRHVEKGRRRWTRRA